MFSKAEFRVLLLLFSGTYPMSWLPDTDNELNAKTFVLQFSLFLQGCDFLNLFSLILFTQILNCCTWPYAQICVCVWRTVNMNEL